MKNCNTAPRVRSPDHAQATIATSECEFKSIMLRFSKEWHRFQWLDFASLSERDLRHFLDTKAGFSFVDNLVVNFILINCMHLWIVHIKLKYTALAAANFKAVSQVRVWGIAGHINSNFVKIGEQRVEAYFVQISGD
jgi:hypothetical protein